MAHVRYVVIEHDPSASLWKASNHRLVSGALDPSFIEAVPDARWARSDPFGAYRRVGDQGEHDEPSPHVVYAALAYRAELADSSDKTKLFHMAINVFVNKFGLLGWFGEEFGAPVLPERPVGGLVRLAPDTIIGKDARLRGIDPATEGKHLQEQLMLHQAQQESARLGLPPPRPGDYYLEPKELILPSELRFQRPSTDFVRTGFSRTPYYERDDEIYPYDDVRRRYGLRVVFDPEHSATGVIILPTREPISMWHTLTGFGDHVGVRYLNRQLNGVSPLVVAGEDEGRTAGWDCPSLLKAVHLMYFLDLLTNVELKKCQAPGCTEYFRARPRSTPQQYCSRPPGKKQSKCASRASSAMHRERERRRSDGA